MALQSKAHKAHVKPEHAETVCFFSSVLGGDMACGAHVFWDGALMKLGAKHASGNEL